MLGGAIAAFALVRRVSPESLPIFGKPAQHLLRTWPPTERTATKTEFIGTTVDTVFVLPDISRYTRFMTGSQFSVGHAQHVVFSLLNAMLEAAHGRLELSKLEGDAALFFADANKYSPEELGQVVVDIFEAFFRERRRLLDSNICPCRACCHIEDLDLKIFVHRGNASRFRFRGSVDHFGADVIVIHRLMKNSVNHHRYVMITDAAATSIAFPLNGQKRHFEEDVEHVGSIGATTIKLSDELADSLAHVEVETPRTVWMLTADTLSKIQMNLKSIVGFAISRVRKRAV